MVVFFVERFFLKRFFSRLQPFGGLFFGGSARVFKRVCSMGFQDSISHAFLRVCRGLEGFFKTFQGSLKRFFQSVFNKIFQWFLRVSLGFWWVFACCHVFF